MKKVLAIVGPTAAGKTELALDLAQRFNGEIISGDSVQIYKGLDIGSAKASDIQRKQVPHHLIDEKQLDEDYSVYHFQTRARKEITEIYERDRLPILVGGTGLYIKACLYDYNFTTEGSNEELLKKYENYSNEELFSELGIVDPGALETIHPHNRKRLIRALIIAKTQGETKTEMLDKQEHKLLYDALIIGLTTERSALYQRINERVEMMIESGLENEVSSLLKRDADLFSKRSMHGIGYKEWQEYFLGNQTREETITLIQQHSRNFAKRQYTWFNNQMTVEWYDIRELDREELVMRIAGWKDEQ